MKKHHQSPASDWLMVSHDHVPAVPLWLAAHTDMALDSLISYPPGVCTWNVAASKNSINSCLLHPLSQKRSKAITRSGYLSDSGRTQKIYEMISLIKKEVRKCCSTVCIMQVYITSLNRVKYS